MTALDSSPGPRSGPTPSQTETFRATSAAALLSMTISRFPTAFPQGPAMGTTQRVAWDEFAELCCRRRTGGKDGDNFIPATFTPDPDGRVRRLKANVLSRTAVALDCETNKTTGELPPAFADAVRRVTERGWAGVIYTSHSHQPHAPRYRVVLPLTEEIGPELPAPEVIAEILGLRGVLDESKIGASSLFYLPSADPGAHGHHEAEAIGGEPIDGQWLRREAGSLLTAREAERERQRAEAVEAATRRREERVKQGHDPDASIIEAVRKRLDLAAELIAHGYERKGDGKYLFPKSETGVPGVYLLSGRDGVDRVYSHHAADPLAAGNLPPWCRAKAIDAVDVVAILDFGGDLTATLRTLADRFGINPKARQEEPPREFDEVPFPTDETDYGHVVVPFPKAHPDGTIPETNRGKPGRQKSREQEGLEPIWGDPVDFLANADATGEPVLLPEHLPDAIATFVFDTAERMGVDPSAVALPALVSCASVITDDWRVQPKRLDHTWTESPRIWGAIVGDPSVMKTPVLKACTAPIDKLEIEARKRHDLEMLRYRTDMTEWKKAKEGDEPKHPVLDRYMVENLTVEALSEVLRDDFAATQRSPAKKVLVRSDELAELLSNLDRYNAGGRGGGDRGAFLRLFNGGRHTVDRVNRGAFACPNWSACILGGIQPGPIQKIARDAADDGMLQRFLFCVPSQQTEGVDREPKRDALSRYDAIFPRLVGLHPERSLAAHDAPEAVRLHADAHQHREAVGRLVAAMLGMPDNSPRIKAALGKFPGIFARLCLLFHLIDVADARVSGSTASPLHVVPAEPARRAMLYLRDILLPHLMRADAVMYLTMQTGHARWIAGFILSRGFQRVTRRDVTRAYGALRAPETERELTSVMNGLVSMEWLREEEVGNPARPPAAWFVNPKIHSVFAARAEHERLARRRAQEGMTALIREKVNG
jgi:hypothetical protein